MSTRMHSRLLVAIALAAGPLFSFVACGGDGDDSTIVPNDDAATDDVVEVDSSFPDEDADLDASTRDASKDAHSDAHADAGTPDAAKTPNECGGYETLEYAGHPATPGDSCGACNDGTLACIGSDSIACAGATSPPCPTPPFDAGPNACGGYDTLTYPGTDASVGAPCGECGSVQCASTTSLTCLSANAYCAQDAGLASACTIPDAAFTAVAPAPTLPPETRPTVTSTSAIGLPASGLAFDPFDGRLYASLTSAVSQGNSIAQIDPTTATVLRTVYVGPAPTLVAISDDGKALWVVVTGQYNAVPTVRRVDLTTFTVGTTITLPTNATVSGLQILAGTENSIAISGQSYSGPPTYQYVYSTVVFDDGVPRPYGVREQSQLQHLTTASPSLALVTGAYPYSSGQVSAVCMNTSGAFFQKTEGSTTSSYYYASPFLYQGVIYAPDGSSYDARTLAALHNFGSTTAPMTASIAADVNDVYFLSVVSKSVGYQATVTGFDRTSFTATSTDILGPSSYQPAAFVRWGRYGFAYLNGTSSIEIARSTIIPDQP